MRAMQTTVVDHPLAQQLLTRLRDERTDRATFRQTTDTLSQILVYEATRSVRTEPVDLTTPLGPTQGVRIGEPPLVVPVLRAGLGMLGAVLHLMPETATAFIGVARNEETFQPEPYMNSVPADLNGRDVMVLDPMLATGGSMEHACRILAGRNAGRLTCVCILSAPEGLARLEATELIGEVVTASIDERLNDLAYIVPGLGDAGDRLFGTA
jgi:uracil phosphoribosyltransferase